MSNTPRTDEVKSRLNGLPDKDQAAYMFFHARELELEVIKEREDSKALNEELRLALIDVNRLLSRIEDLKHEGLWGRPDRF